MKRSCQTAPVRKVLETLDLMESSPVHACAQFDEDGSCNDNPNLWSVHFPEGKQLLPVTLFMPEDVQIQFGRTCKAAFNDGGFETFPDEDARVHENGKVVSFCFSGSSSLAVGNSDGGLLAMRKMAGDNG